MNAIGRADVLAQQPQRSCATVNAPAALMPSSGTIFPAANLASGRDSALDRALSILDINFADVGLRTMFLRSRATSDSPRSELPLRRKIRAIQRLSREYSQRDVTLRGCRWSFNVVAFDPARDQCGTGLRSAHSAWRFLAVTSISILTLGSMSPAVIIVAAGRTSPRYLRSTGQQTWKSSARGRI